MPKLWSLSFLTVLIALAVAAALALFHWRDTPAIAAALAMVALGFLLVAFYLARPQLRRWLVLAIAVTAAAPLGACAGLVPGGLGSNAAAINSGFAQFLTDPNCAHHDEATLITGAAGMPASFQAKAVRDCPARAPAAGVAALGVAPAAGAAPVAAVAVTPPAAAATP